MIKEVQLYSASSLSVPGGGEEVDTSEADLVALLATQAIKEEKKKLKPGLKQRKKGGKTERCTCIQNKNVTIHVH